MLPPALKAGEPTRRSDTSTPDATAKQGTPTVWDQPSLDSVIGMSKNRLLLGVVLIVLLVLLGRKVKDV